MQKLNLDALDTMRHTVEKGGVSYMVKPITARIAGLVEAAGQAEGIAKIGAFGAVVAALIPDMPGAEVEELTVAQLAAVIELASTQVRAVEEAVADPNAASPVAPGSSPPAISSAASS